MTKDRPQILFATDGRRLHPQRIDSGAEGEPLTGEIFTIAQFFQPTIKSNSIRDRLKLIFQGVQ